MSDNASEEPRWLYASRSSRERRVRTYSHKGKNGRCELLPRLKPSNTPRRKQPTTVITHEAYSQPEDIANDVGTEEADDFTNQAGNDIELDSGADDHVDGDEHMEDSSDDILSVTRLSSLRPRSSRKTYDIYDSETSKESQASGRDDNDDESDVQDSGTTPASSLERDQSRSSSQNINRATGTRRRPFLIFDKVTPRGYKMLKGNTEGNNDTKSKKTPLASRYRLGDGFSNDEAKENGVKRLTRKRKSPSFIVSEVGGILDLTQSSVRAQEQNRRESTNKTSHRDKRTKPNDSSKKRSTQWDNSFLTTSTSTRKGPARRVKKPNQLDAIVPRHSQDGVDRNQQQEELPEDLSGKNNTPRGPEEGHKQTSPSALPEDSEIRDPTNAHDGESLPKIADFGRESVPDDEEIIPGNYTFVPNTALPVLSQPAPRSKPENLASWETYVSETSPYRRPPRGVSQSHPESARQAPASKRSLRRVNTTL